jgi:hypothetical protein
MNLRDALSEADGQQYFDSKLKDSGVPQLRGVLVSATPACRPKELMVAIQLPDAKGAPKAEIKLKLDKPLTVKPELNQEIRWEGVPSAFTKEPFLLTMDTDADPLAGLKSSPCPAPPAKK